MLKTFLPNNTINFFMLNFNPFQIYSQQFQTLLTQAKDNENPALFLYQNGARNVVFMLEGLTRLHKEAFEHKNGTSVLRK
jgi:hypothetical protein